MKPGVLYRSGQMTAEGFRDAVAKYGIRTIVNCQNEFPDPDLPLTFRLRQTIRESELCRDLGVRYVHLDPDLVSNRCDPSARPQVLDEFLSIVDNVAAHPILLHCKAGLHRTGILVAVYRQEYDRWGPYAAPRRTEGERFRRLRRDCSQRLHPTVRAQLPPPAMPIWSIRMRTGAVVRFNSVDAEERNCT